MADNFSANAGSGGDTFAADDVGGVKYLRNKMVWGADGAVNDVSAAAPMPTNLTTLPTLTKGTQGATGISTQDLKDAGRSNIAITCYQAAGIITTEALFGAATFSKSVDGAAATTGIQFSVTAGKKFRIQSIVVTVHNTAAAATTSKLALRWDAANGTITNASPILAVWDIGSNNATDENYIGPISLPFPDGLDLSASSSFGFTNLSSAVTAVHTITLSGFEY